MSLGVHQRKKEDVPDSYPRNKVKEVLTAMHGRTSGTNNTKDKVWQHYYWLHLRGNIEVQKPEFGASFTYTTSELLQTRNS
jgi:hypothetical protein